MENNQEKLSTDKKNTKKPNLKYLRDMDRRMVRGIFKFYEVPSGTMMFSYRAYREDPIENFTLVDGQVYTLPLGVAKHLNNNCWYPIHSYVQNEDKNVSLKVGQKVHRCGFQSLEFIDIEELGPVSKEIVTVEQGPLLL